MNITIESLIKAIENKGYVLFSNGDYNLNLIGVRTADDTANTFNDWFCVLYKVDGQWQLNIYRCTTDPGLYYRLNPMNVSGTAILKPAQHRGCWRVGLHRGRYKALVQYESMTVYRDDNKDNKLDTDPDKESHGMFGINCHRAREYGVSKLVDKWSAGCQVLASGDDFDELMKLVEKSDHIYGDKFTYTLLEEHDIGD